MTQAYDAIIATITTASDATSVIKSMVKSTTWREGTSGTWLSTDCTLTAGKVYQFRNAFVWNGFWHNISIAKYKSVGYCCLGYYRSPITSVGNYFMAYYAYVLHPLLPHYST